MHFLNSPLLWGGLGLLGVSVPIIIHLLNRYRHKQVDWAAMELLKRAMTIRSRQIRIEDILLMILRCLAMLLIAMALMRPTITSSGAHWLGQQQVGAVIAVDASYSMSHREVTTRFDRAKARVQEILDQLHPGNPISLVMMGNRNRVLLRNVGYDKERFAKAIAEAQVLPEPLNVQRCLSDTDPSSPGLNQLRDELKSPVRECYIVTDAAASKWKNLSDASPLKSLGEKGSLLFLPIPEESIENLAITRFDFAAGSLRHGNTARYTAEVKNFGKLAAPPNTTISLLANEQPVEQHVLTIEPGESQLVPFFYHCDAPGDIKLTARLSQDALTLDNERHVVAHVRDRLRILCVDGDIAQGALRFISNALAPKTTAIYKSMVLENVSSLDLPQRPLTDFDLVILANVGNLEPEQAKKIATFVQQGGGLIIFPGDHVDPVTFNAQMKVGDISLLPGEFGELTKAPAKFEGWTVESGATGHRLANALQHLPRDITQQPTIRAFLPITLSKGSAEVLRIAGVNSPLLAEKQLGQGRILLWATTADKKWGDFVINPLFPAVMNDAVTLLSQRPNERPLLVGAPINLPLAAERAQDNIVVKNPAGVEIPTRSVTADTRAALDYKSTDQPGFYEVKVGNTTTVAAVNLDPAASDVAFLDRGAITTAFRNLPVKTVYPGKDDLPTVVRQSRNGTELWQKLLGAGLLLLLIESFLARRFSRRMAAGKGASNVSRREELLGPNAAAAAA